MIFDFFFIKIVKIVVGDHNFKFKPKTNILSSNFKSCECSIFKKIILIGGLDCNFQKGNWENE